MVGSTSRIDLGDTDYVVDDDTFDQQPNLSPISIRTSSERINTGSDNNDKDKFPIFNDNSSLLGIIVDRSSFDDDDELTTFGGRTAGGRDAPSVIDENHPSSMDMSLSTININQQLQNQQQHLIDMNNNIPGGVMSMGGSGVNARGSSGTVMRNGKVRRKLRWKPRFGKNKDKSGNGGGNVSSDASVMSALTNRSNSTSRSSSTTRSFLSHFSRRSVNSFHTFHSTATPKATNKANRPQAPHTVMRPNYQDSFSSNNSISSKSSKHATIDTEGEHILQQQNHHHQNHQRIRSFRSSLDSVEETASASSASPSSPSASASLADRADVTDPDDDTNNDSKKVEVVQPRPNSSGIPRSPSSSVTDSKKKNINFIKYEAVISTIDKSNTTATTSKSSTIDKSNNTSSSTTNKSSAQKPPLSSSPPKKSQPQQHQLKPRRPPLFKRRMRHFKNSSKTATSAQQNPPSPSSPTDTNSTTTSSSSISPSGSLSLERESSVIPMSLGEEYEEDRRVLFKGDTSITTTTKQKQKPTTTTKKNTILNRNSSSSNKKNRDIVTVTRTAKTRSSSVDEEKKDEESSSVVTGSMSGCSASTHDEDIVLEEGIEESSVCTGDYQSIQSGSVNNGSSGRSRSSSVHSSSSNAAGSHNSSSEPSTTILKKRISSITKKRSNSSSSTSRSTASPKRGVSGGSGVGGSNINSPPSPKQYNHPSDSISNLTSKGKKNSSSKSTSVPCDLDEGKFVEAENNLRAIHEMAAEHMAHGEYEEAADVFEEILRGQQERYGQDHYRVGTALHNLGIVYLKKGDYKKAIGICQRAVAVRKESLVPNHPDVAVSLAQLGVAHLESQNFKKALAAFRDALHIRRNFLGHRHPKCSKILNNIGCALYSIEDFPASKCAFDEALDIQRDALRSIPSNESTESTRMQTNAFLLSMASTLCNIGSIKLRWGEFDEATVDLEEALLIQQSVLGDDHPTVLSTSDSIELVDSAKYSAANPRSQAHKYLMNKAVAVCSDSETNPATMMTDLFSIENLETISPKNWFMNPCGPVGCVNGKHTENL
jgi:tetratricopeptide (TPR) repeat protein